MYQSLLKMFSFMTVLGLMMTALPLQPAMAAGEPIAPSLLEAQPSFPGDLAITITWSDNSLDETEFEIERCIGVGCTDFTLYATRDSSIFGSWFNDVGLAEVTTYSYRVRAVNAAGASDYSNVASATTSYARPDGQVTSLVGAFSNGAVELTWTENATNETRYEIERYEVGGGGTEFIVVGTVAPDTTSFVDSTALQGTVYDYRVVPWRFDIGGGAPIVVTVETGTGIAGPTEFKAKTGAPLSINLSWKGNFAAGTQIIIQRQVCDEFGCSGLTTIAQVDASTKRFTDTGLLPNTTYSYRVRAILGMSVSPFTNYVTATTRR
ncbi:MAG TPA: fibronectin type III domain-containing protein [Anaerolineales bacterium]|nr:fibronectin type III domain-containing protein [Anaerolineales bacterium]